MEIELDMISIKEVVRGYVDKGEDGVTGYSSRLDIRPPYQREFVYNDEQRDEVIKSAKNGFPLNVMYWARTGVNENGLDTYEILDGQQRTISICKYVTSKFALDDVYFHSLTEEEQEEIYNYELMVYKCDGTAREKLDWFETVNIVGEPLTDQELRNAVYAGSWVNSAKKYFSKSTAPIKDVSEGLMSGSSLRQDYLQKVLKWIADEENTTIGAYMSEHQYDKNADELWEYAQAVFYWVNLIFTKKSSHMKKIEWGLHFNKYRHIDFDSKVMQEKVDELMDDIDVKRKAGIYNYVFDNNESHLNLRTFDEPAKRAKYKEQAGVCPRCGKDVAYEETHADHITPWSKGGKTEYSNLQMLCTDCNRRKSDM